MHARLLLPLLLLSVTLPKSAQVGTASMIWSLPQLPGTAGVGSPQLWPMLSGYGLQAKKKSQLHSESQLKRLLRLTLEFFFYYFPPRKSQ